MAKFVLLFFVSLAAADCGPIWHRFYCSLLHFRWTCDKNTDFWKLIEFKATDDTYTMSCSAGPEFCNGVTTGYQAPICAAKEEDALESAAKNCKEQAIAERGCSEDTTCTCHVVDKDDDSCESILLHGKKITAFSEDPRLKQKFRQFE